MTASMDTPIEGMAANAAPAKPPKIPVRRAKRSDLSAMGEWQTWMMGAALVIGLTMIIGFLAYIISVGAVTFWPKPVFQVTTTDGKVLAGELFRTETYKPPADQLAQKSPEVQAMVAKNLGYVERTLYRVGNYDLFGEDFVWIPEYDVKSIETPSDFFFVERKEWGPFIGRIKEADLKGAKTAVPSWNFVLAEQAKAKTRLAEINHLDEVDITNINKALEKLRLVERRAVLEYGIDSPEAKRAATKSAAEKAKLEAEYAVLEKKINELRANDAAYTVTLEAIDGQTKTLRVSELVRVYPANRLTSAEKWSVYGDRWREFVSSNPREANTEGGVLPAIVGTLTMMILLSLAVAPFGVVTALYLREYASQGALVSFIRICVNNLAGVPSIVYGVFGLGFFCYIVGGSIDQIFYPERLPAPTFGTGGMLWASLTLALLTVPVVIVATEEALAAVPRSMREGSLACGASKWQTIWRIVLPRAAPGIMTGLILAMARGAGEVAPLMIVGVVKLAPELPVDFTWPFVHFERSFMHLGFHIYDVGFQSRNSEAGRPMVLVTTLVLILLVLALNAFAIYVRNRLKKQYQGGQF
jgi:phosphate transport system permease protein